MKRPLFSYIYPTYVAIVALCLGALITVESFTIHSFVFQIARSELTDIIVLTEKFFFPPTLQFDPQGDHRALITEWDQRLEYYFADRSFRVTIIGADGTVLADSKATAANLENHRQRPEVKTALEGQQGTALRRSQSVGEELVYLAEPIIRGGSVVAVVRAAIPLDLIQKQLWSMYLRLALGALGILALAAGLTLFLVRKISQPIGVLVQSAERFGRGELHHRTRIEGPRELVVLASTLDTMAEQLKERIDQVIQGKREAEAILSGMTEGIIVLDRNFLIRQVNDSALSIFAIPKGTPVIGKSLLEVFRATDLKRLAEQVLRNPEFTENDPSLNKMMEDTFNLWTGSNRTLQVSASAIPNYSGCLLVIHDITRMMHLETVRRDFVANVSHELKTPITSIKGFVETLLDGALDDRPRAERYLGIIGRHANRLEQIIEDLLSLARLEQQEKQTLETQAVSVFALCEEARQSCELSAQEKEIRIQIEGPRELQWKANVSLMTQAILNLLDNAIKYSSPKTSIRLCIEPIEGYVLLKVIDQGRGIPPRDLQRIFERFYRVNKERSREVGGTGLGLSIVKHVVTLHGGTVQVESQENEGSTFTIQLPQDT